MKIDDRMKMYERNGMPPKAMPYLPVLVRLDGRAFHTFCKGLGKPYDSRMCYIMGQVTKYLVEQTNACLGYTQSDEISLVLFSDDLKSQIFFDGKRDKLTSVICSMATWKFNSMIPRNIPEKANKPAFFDCRVWQVPNKTEAVNAVLWREFDATKNSISSAAQSVYSHKELQNRHSDEMQEMLFQKGINWNNYPAYFKRGEYFQRREVAKPFTAEEIEKLPPKHAAHNNPDLVVFRKEVASIEMPKFSTVVNREEVVFDGKQPLFKLESGPFIKPK